MLVKNFSGNFKDDAIGDQIFDAVLEPGDLLYFPRGFVHQAQAVPNNHSLHITISTYQRNSWADALEEVRFTKSLTTMKFLSFPHR